ncbi:hypothetical protein D3C73_665140 [compost metagenome]
MRRSRTHRLPRASNTTLEPSGEVWAQRIIFTSNWAGATSTGKRAVSCTRRVSATRKGMSLTALEATSTRRILPPAQMTMERLSGVQAKPG